MRIQMFDFKNESRDHQNFNPSFYVNKQWFDIYPHETLLFVIPRTKLTKIMTWPENSTVPTSGQISILVRNKSNLFININARMNLQTILNKKQLLCQDFFTPEYILDNVHNIINNHDILIEK